jgi:hypothetical protein
MCSAKKRLLCLFGLLLLSSRVRRHQTNLVAIYSPTCDEPVAALLSAPRRCVVDGVAFPLANGHDNYDQLGIANFLNQAVAGARAV